MIPAADFLGSFSHTGKDFFFTFVIGFSTTTGFLSKIN